MSTMSNSEERPNAEPASADNPQFRPSAQGSSATSSSTGGPGGSMLTSPQRLPAERLQAARAAAAAMASSSVRCGYFAAALARAGNRGGYPQSAAVTGVGSSAGDGIQHHGVAAAAVRLAAVHAAAAAAAAAAGEMPDMPEARTQSSCKPLESLSATFATPATSSDAASEMPEISETSEESSGTPPETPRAAATMVWPATPESAVTGSHASSTWQFFTWQRDAASTDTSGMPNDSVAQGAEEVSPSRHEVPEPQRPVAFSKTLTYDAAATEPASGDRTTLGSIVVGPSTEHEAASDEAVAGVWDVVVEKTFIAVVPRRHVLQHTASAPGCLGIFGEAGIVVGRHRRQRSSRRRSRRRIATANQAAYGNSVQLH